MTDSGLPFSTACERNREPILAVLCEAFDDAREVLEVGSGTGQHAVYFAASLPRLHWQPTERQLNLPSLAARIQLEGTPNLRAPVALDVAELPWPKAPVTRGSPPWDAAFTANTLHILSAALVERLFAGLGAALAPHARLAIYGPFRYRGQFTSASNAKFDATLRERDPDSGLRDVEWIHELAGGQGFNLVADHGMPAHNQLLIWQRG